MNIWNLEYLYFGFVFLFDYVIMPSITSVQFCILYYGMFSISTCRKWSNKTQTKIIKNPQNLLKKVTYPKAIIKSKINQEKKTLYIANSTFFNKNTQANTQIWNRLAQTTIIYMQPRSWALWHGPQTQDIVFSWIGDTRSYYGRGKIRSTGETQRIILRVLSKNHKDYGVWVENCLGMCDYRYTCLFILLKKYYDYVLS